ncbi:MAG: PKD domain-containing protein [Nitrospirota bacterium]
MTHCRQVERTSSSQFVRMIVGIALLSLFSGCGGGSSSDSGQPAPDSIGVEGGTVLSSDGRVVLTIPRNSVMVATVFAIDPSTGTAPPARAVSAVYDVEPTGTQFASNALPQLTIDYGTLPNGTDPSGFTIGTLANGQWVDVPGSVVDQANHTVTAPLQHLSPYAVLQPSSEPNGNQAPVISNVSIPATGIAGEPVSFSGAASDNDGDPLTFTWNFGDGSPLQASTSGMGTHTYAIAASYDVTLTVTDGHGGTATSAAQTIVISSALPGNNPPVITSMMMPTASSVIAGQPITVTATASDPDGGNTLKFSWDFGDGSDNTPPNTSSLATHQYDYAGSYVVTLTVTDGQGGSDVGTETLVVLAPPNSPPVASAGGPYVGIVGEIISFSAAGSSDPDGSDLLTYAWDFGDGNAGAGVSDTHPYSAAGQYTVTLTVTDPGGLSSSATANATISTPTPGNGPPTVSVTIPSSGLVLQNLILRGSGSDPDGDTLSYSWNFGDGASTAFGPNPSVVHEYAQAGVYTATLTANDGQGHSVSAGGTVSVTVPSRPVAFAQSLLLLRRSDNFGPNLYRNAIELDGAGVAPLRFNIVQYPTNWASDAKSLDVFTTYPYQWWDPINNRLRPECLTTLNIPATCFPTASSRVDFVIDSVTQLPTGTGEITMTPATAPPTVSYMQERCWIWPGLSDSFTFTVTDGNNVTSDPAAVTIQIRSNTVCHYIPP